MPEYIRKAIEAQGKLDPAQVEDIVKSGKIPEPVEAKPVVPVVEQEPLPIPKEADDPF